MRWRRLVFLALTATIALAVVLAARDVMLPFVMAAVIAYVLTPLVAWVEARRIPRGAAVLLVYAVVLGSVGGFVRGVAPRLAFELTNLRGELPALAREAREKWVPALTERLRAAGLAPALPARGERRSPPRRAPSSRGPSPTGPWRSTWARASR